MKILSNKEVGILLELLDASWDCALAASDILLVERIGNFERRIK